MENHEVVSPSVALTMLEYNAKIFGSFYYVKIHKRKNPDEWVLVKQEYGRHSKLKVVNPTDETDIQGYGNEECYALIVAHSLDNLKKQFTEPELDEIKQTIKSPLTADYLAEVYLQRKFLSK
jgi:hypothetical protein